MGKISTEKNRVNECAKKPAVMSAAKTDIARKDAKIKNLKDKLDNTTRELENAKSEISELRKLVNSLKDDMQKKFSQEKSVSVNRNNEDQDDEQRPRKQFRREPSQETEMDIEIAQASASYANVTKTIPPVVIQGAGEWLKVRNKLKENKIMIDKAKLTGEDTKIFPKSAEDHRNLTRLLSAENKQFYTYNVASDKKYHAVLKGLDRETPVDYIKTELENLGFLDVEVSRMTSLRTKLQLSFYYVRTASKEIFSINRLLDLVVTVEPKRKPNAPSQCYRCQRFGHTQRFCAMNERCVRCTKNHGSRSCDIIPQDNKEKVSASCVNCGNEGHPASYRGCPKYKEYISGAKRITNKTNAAEKKVTNISSTNMINNTPNNSKNTNLSESMLNDIMPIIMKSIQEYLKSHGK